jgi:radical SAM superfamily enzyme YgiQ (UPF0313 family)
MGNIKKILIIEPVFHRLYKKTFSLDRYPLSLGYLATTIKKETNWQVMTYNADFNPNLKNENMDIKYLTGEGFQNYLKNLNNLSYPVWLEIKKTIVDFQPDVVGISAKTQNFKSATIIAKITKEISNKIVVVIGGPHATIANTEILKDDNIDIVVRGEGEGTIVDLLNNIGKEDSKFELIAGISYRYRDKIIENPPRELIRDLNTLGFPHEYAKDTLKNYSQYPKSAFSNIFSTRGCPHNCFFCGSKYIWGRKVRFRNVENIISEIRSLQQMGVTHINFSDDTFGINSNFIKSLCLALIEHCPSLRWSCEIHVKLVTEENISIMKTAGCDQIQIGIESGNNEMLKRIRKNITIEEAFNAIKIIEKYGIYYGAFFILGFPDDTEETLQDTISAMKKINGGLCYSIFTPYPGTEAYEYCKTNGLIPDNFDISLYSHQSPENCFCKNVSKERLYEIRMGIESYVDNQNYCKGFESIFSRKKLIDIPIFFKSYGLKNGTLIIFLALKNYASHKLLKYKLKE